LRFFAVHKEVYPNEPEVDDEERVGKGGRGGGKRKKD
jgi:hypothetical protein